MRFLIDAQLPPSLGAWLINQGHHADHIFALGLTEAEDPDIWNLACQLNAALITKDEDFMLIRERATAGPPVIWLRLGNATNVRLLSWLAPRWPVITAAIAAGDVLVEVR